MKSHTKTLLKLIDFLIRVLTKVVKAGLKAADELIKVQEKSSKLFPILTEIAKILETLKNKRDELEKLNQ